VLASAVLAAGCGSSSSSSSSSGGSSSSSGSGSTTSAALSKEDFLAKANAICDTINTQIKALPEISTAADLLSTGPKEVALAENGIAQLKALEPPDSLKTQTSQYFANLDQQATISTKLITAFKNKDSQTLAQAEAAAKTNQSQGHTQANGIGLTRCAKEAQPSG
jgi:hypothetical protein